MSAGEEAPRLRRTAKGKRPRYFSDPATDRLLGILMSLIGEVSVLRDRLGMTGTHKDCCMGICGSCTVLVDDRPVSSCLLLAAQIDGQSVRTVEGLERDGSLSPLQEAFLTYGAVQCGYCTPGFLMMAVSFLKEHPKPTEHEVREALVGNICRCTGYVGSVRAVMAVAESQATDRPESQATGQPEAPEMSA